MKKLMSILFAALMLLSVVPLGVISSAEGDKTYEVGDRIQFGSYPQSEVTDKGTLKLLNATDTEWKSYNYYSGHDSYNTGSPSDYMEYREATVGGLKYRAVRFTKYRPTETWVSSDDEGTSSVQDDNNYFVGEVYWFRYEPISWRILDPSEGLVMSETILDSQAYYNSKESSNYSSSSIREWLNDDFYNTAFTTSQKSNIETTHLVNKAIDDAAYNAPDTDDKIFLLSYWDMTNESYGFSSNRYLGGTRQAKGSDYAQAQGLDVYRAASFEESSPWHLRSPYRNQGAGHITSGGYVVGSYYVLNTSVGIRPACRLAQLSSGGDASGNTSPKITAQPNCLTQTVGTTAEFTVAATGSGTLSYQWKVSTDGRNWTNSKMTGYNTETLKVPVKNDKNGYMFRCVVTDSNGSVTSNVATLTVVKAVGDHIQFGSYPQSEVTDSATLELLNATDTVWESYNYYSGDGSNGSMGPSDYMQYRDATLGSEKYRAVRFTQYRPQNTVSKCTANMSAQDENGYTTGNTYWFKYEPITWRILDPIKGLVMSETLLDSQAFNNYSYVVTYAQEEGSDNGENGDTWYGDPDQSYYASNYSESSIRKWLNEDFYNTAFTESQKSNIKITHQNNYSDWGEEFGSPDTNDKVFLLSSIDVTNSSYGFSSSSIADPALRAQGSDYAKAQGLWVSDSGNGHYVFSDWRLRTATVSSVAMSVGYNGGLSDVNDVCDACMGIRPACRLAELKSDVSASGINSPKITLQPKSLTQAVGTTAEFTVAATGSGTLSYQWKVSADGTSWTKSKMTGYNTDTLQVPVKFDKNGYKFLCVVSDENGSVTSSAATLTVKKSTVEITAQPESVSQEIGTTAKFTVAATGVGTLKYQWRVSADGGATWVDSKMTGYDTPELSVPVKMDKNGYKFKCIIKDKYGSESSDIATLTAVKNVLTITSQPESVTQAVGTTAEFTVTATGSGTLSYQWKVSKDGISWTNSKMTGYNTATLQVPVKYDKNGYKFICVVRDAKGSVTSSVATLTVA